MATRGFMATSCGYIATSCGCIATHVHIGARRFTAAPVAMPARMESKVGWVDEADDAVVVNSVSESEDEAVVIRSFFPETWLWDLETVE